MIPVAIAKEILATKEPTEEVLLNNYEIMNVLSTELMTDVTPHLKLTRVIDVTRESIIEPWKPILALSTNANFTVNILKYGTGAFSLRII